MRKQIAAANWKMNGTLKQAESLLEDILKAGIELKDYQETIFAVPFPFLMLADKRIAGNKGYYISAQNCSNKPSGAFTGETSAEILQSIGIHHCITGHSERREYFNETNAMLAEKLNLCLQNEITPIFCCGEPLEIRDAGTQDKRVETQISESLFHLSAADIQKVVIAYEPIWAIGTGKTASTQQAQDMHAFIRSVIQKHYGEQVSNNIPILYGGSVKANNAPELFGSKDVDGGLVGGASLIAADFIQIIRALKTNEAHSWLASWYPDKLQPLNGDFIERHAKAASLYNKISVLHVVKDNRDIIPGKFFVERKKYSENCTAVILYYKPFSGIAAIERSLAAIRFFIFFAELIRDHIHENSKPDLIHVHVSWRAGLLALYCRWKYKLPFVLSEHWTGFLPGADDNFSSLDSFSKKIISTVFKGANKVSAVSEVLAGELVNNFKIKKPIVIPNVVDTMQFLPSENRNETFRFIHISELTKAKNPQQIISALKILSEKTKQPFECLFFSPLKNEIVEQVNQLGLQKYIRFEGHVPHSIIAAELTKSDCPVLYSAYETFGCVVIEAMACGLPVIVSDIPVMHELVTNKTGIFAELNNTELLAEKMLWMMEHQQTAFDKNLIAQYTAEQFGMEITGKKFDDFYNA